MDEELMRKVAEASTILDEINKRFARIEERLDRVERIAHGSPYYSGPLVASLPMEKGMTEPNIPIVSGGLRGDDVIMSLDEKGRYLIERDGKRLIVDPWMIEPALPAADVAE